jgi:hypothetical protein
MVLYVPRSAGRQAFEEVERPYRKMASQERKDGR